MTHQHQKPHHEKSTFRSRTEAPTKLSLIVGMMRIIPADSYFARILGEVTPMFLQAAAQEHGRLTREGKARAKARRATLREVNEVTGLTSAVREVVDD